MGGSKTATRNNMCIRRETKFGSMGTTSKHTTPAKLVPKRHGTFSTQRALSPINYQLMLLEQRKIHNGFQIDLLTPYREMEFHGPNYNQPPPDLMGEEEQYKVEQVLDEHIYGHWKKKQYLVKWKGYPDSDNQWLDAKDMENAQELIAEFHNLNPKTSSHIKRALECFSSLHPPSALPHTLNSIHMSNASSTLNRMSVHGENTNLLPILPCSSSPVPDEAPIHVQNQFAELLPVCKDRSTNITGITFCNQPRVLTCQCALVSL